MIRIREEMNPIKCELCGSTDILKDGDVYVCQYCRVKYTSEAAAKLMVKIDGPVSVEGISNEENLMQRADEFALSGNEEKAAEYYNRVLDIDPSNEKAKAWLLDKKKRDAAKAEAIFETGTAYTVMSGKFRKFTLTPWPWS